MKLMVCRTCSEEGGFADVLRAELSGVEVEDVDCMSGCTRAQTVAFREPGKVAYLFGEVTAEDIPSLRTFVTLYAKSADGTFEDARVLGALRTKAIARIPG